ncbi:g10820 [Coccomyxa viridis]|uniref:G10820 protein n=1 Tax=Coccomyxa viridis TaxID=1274662 RepID=A0ABP1G7K5_9CHLO
MWFDLQLLQAVDTEMCVIKRQSMDRRCDVLMRVHEHCGCHDVPLNYDTLRKRLGEAVREYGYLMAAQADLQSLGVSNYPKGLLSDCGGCWEAAQPANEGGGRPLHSIYIDYCFKLNHLTRADTSGNIWDVGTKRPPFSRYFIQDDEVVQHLRDPQSTLLPDESRLQCSDFKADEVLGRTTGGKNDITSLGMCLCRHGHIGFLMNSVTGERHAYATLFVKAILSCIISSLLFVWYDINCRWAASFLKWLASQGAALREKAARLQYPLPRMHFWAHRVECQQEFGHVRMQQAGRGNGEPHEIANAAFAPLGKTTMYMSRMNRQARLERVALFYTEQRALRLPGLLLRMLARACAALQESQAAAEAAHNELRRKGLSEAQIQTGLQTLSASAESPPVAMSWQADLARCQLVLHKASLADGDTSTPALLLVFEDPAFAKLAPNSIQVKRARSRLQQLMQTHSAELAGKDLAVASTDFKFFLAAFVAYKVHSLQEELAAKAVQYAHLQALMPRLSERSVEQTKITNALLRVANAMDSKAVALQSWVSGNYVDASLLPASVAQLKEGCALWEFKSFHRGVFPWQPAQAQLEGKSVIQLLTDLHMRVCECQRAQEEVSLVQKEKQSALRLYARRAAALTEAIAAFCEAMHVSTVVHEASSVDERVQHQQNVRSAMVQEGISVALEQKLQRVQALQAHARFAFALPVGEVLPESSMHGAALPYLSGDELVLSDSDEE